MLGKERAEPDQVVLNKDIFLAELFFSQTALLLLPKHNLNSYDNETPEELAATKVDAAAANLLLEFLLLIFKGFLHLVHETALLE